MEHKDLPKAVRFELDTAPLYEPLSTYAAGMSSLLAHRMREVADRSNDDLATETILRVEAAVSASAPSSRPRVLLAPETSYRLRHRAAEIAALQFVADAFTFEAAFASPDPSPTIDVWSALGDAYLDSSAVVHRQPQVEGLPPLDFNSPHSLNIDLSGEMDRALIARAPLSHPVQKELVRKLRSASDVVHLHSEYAVNFVRSYTRVICLQSDGGDFSSGTSAQFIGRCVLANPQIVGTSLLVEAIVHESIHGLIYMQELKTPWTLSTDTYSKDCRIISPWSGNPLPFRSYLQACFVWYGLMHFWRVILMQGNSAPPGTRERFLTARRGFGRGDPVGQIPVEILRGVDPELITTIQSLAAV